MSRTLRTRLRLYSAVSPVLVVGGGRVRAVVCVGFCRVISSGCGVDARVLVLVGVERLPVRGGAGRAVAVSDSRCGAVVARIRGGGLG